MVSSTKPPKPYKRRLTLKEAKRGYPIAIPTLDKGPSEPHEHHHAHIPKGTIVTVTRAYYRLSHEVNYNGD